jgi:hypothetical protein
MAHSRRSSAAEGLLQFLFFHLGEIANDLKFDLVEVAADSRFIGVVKRLGCWSVTMGSFARIAFEEVLPQSCSASSLPAPKAVVDSRIQILLRSE